jgi:hypothetical protein
VSGYAPVLVPVAAALLAIVGRWRSRAGRPADARPGSPIARFDVAILLALAAVEVATLLAMGREAVCRCGVVGLWSGDVWSNQNSQQLADPYSFTHLTHGVLFYWLLRLLAGRQPLGLRAILALSIEAVWEVFENTDATIQRYREATISLDYYGDSALNSFGDLLCCLLGFALAARLPGRVALVGVVVLEVVLAVWIRDSLALNILMLIRPIQAIKDWQLGGAPAR